MSVRVDRPTKRWDEEILRVETLGPMLFDVEYETWY